MNKHLRIPLLASKLEQTPFPPLVACIAGAWKWWAKERTGVREGDTRVSLARTFFLVHTTSNRLLRGLRLLFYSSFLGG